MFAEVRRCPGNSYNSDRAQLWFVATEQNSPSLENPRRTREARSGGLTIAKLETEP